TIFGALLLGFSPAEAGAVGIIGGADGPTAIFTATRLAPHLLGPVAVAAYSYMALVPIIQPPIMKLLTTKRERNVKMDQMREVKKIEKIILPVVVTVLGGLLVPSALPLLGSLMFGNLIREVGVVDRLLTTVQNSLMNTVTIFLGLTVGATARAEAFLNPETIGIIILGLVAFSFGTISGVLLGKLMYYLSNGRVNPLLGAAGVSAVPMAARVVHKVALEEDSSNYLLMHAMAPNFAGVIGSAIAAGSLLAVL
ncbi:MAG: sodium ion-translocating decarboxylase subunit beta, partial [Halanaerobiales bacterium]